MKKYVKPTLEVVQLKVQEKLANNEYGVTEFIMGSDSGSYVGSEAPQS